MVNTDKGYDVMRGQTVIKHFDNKVDAINFIGDRHGYYIRYWMMNEE